MKLLLDECVPRRLRRLLVGHDVRTAPEMGWANIRNGALLALAAAQFDAFITVDRNIQHQQNLKTLPIAVVVLSARSNKPSDLTPLVPNLLAALNTLVPKTLITVQA